MRKTIALLSSKGFPLKNSIIFYLSQKFLLPEHINLDMYLYLITDSVQSLKLSWVLHIQKIICTYIWGIVKLMSNFLQSLKLISYLFLAKVSVFQKVSISEMKSIFDTFPIKMKVSARLFLLKRETNCTLLERT